MSKKNFLTQEGENGPQSSNQGEDKPKPPPERPESHEHYDVTKSTDVETKSDGKEKQE